MEELAAKARMGVSTLHHQFRALTAMSPLQYQKQLRLQAARQRMLMDGIDATSAAFEVGYESVSQFSREYSRFFGQPPMRDIKSLRDGKVAAIAAALAAESPRHCKVQGGVRGGSLSVADHRRGPVNPGHGVLRVRRPTKDDRGPYFSTSGVPAAIQVALIRECSGHQCARYTCTAFSKGPQLGVQSCGRQCRVASLSSMEFLMVSISGPGGPLRQTQLGEMN